MGMQDTMAVKRTRRAVAALFALILGPSTMSTARAESTTVDVRDVGPFHAVEITTGGSVTLRQGDTPRVRIEARPSTLEHLTTVVERGVLTVSMTPFHRPLGPLDIDIVYASLDSLVLSGSAQVATDVIESPSFDAAIRGSADLLVSAIVAEKLVVMVSGSGDFVVADAAATTTEVQVSGSGDVTLAGATERLNVTVSGSGSVDARGFDAGDVIATVTGSGNVDVAVDATLSVTLSGSGDLTYRGEPEVDSRISGSGRLRSR